MPETLRSRRDRLPLSAGHDPRGGGETLSIRASIGNTLASTLAFGGLFAFIGSIQQIVFDVFGRPELIGIVFACIAGPMALDLLRQFAAGDAVRRAPAAARALAALTVSGARPSRGRAGRARRSGPSSSCRR